VTGVGRAVALVSLAALGVVTGCAGDRRATRIVFVTLDTTRADRLGCYGYADAATPNLDRLAQDAIVFEQAVSSVPTTLPAHSTMFTGLYPQDHGVRYNLVFRLGSEAATLAEILRDAGYATAGFPATFIVGRQFGLQQGFDTYPDPPGSESGPKDPMSHAGLPAGTGVDRALAWIETQPAGAKQFVWLHFYDPHVPYAPPFPYASQFRDRPYDGEIAYMDAQFGRLLEALEESDRWDETLLIVVGDHGEGLYDHGERLHGSLVYESTQHVPLIVRAPGSRPRRVPDPVGLVDLFPTVLEIAGLEPRATRGTNLGAAIYGRGRIPLRDVYFESLAGSLNYGWAELRGLRHGPWKLIDAPRTELYHVERDPAERDNLAGREADRRGEMLAALAALADPLAGTTTVEPAHDAVLDPATEQMLVSLGYVAGGAGGSAEGAPSPASVIDLEAELLAGQAAVSQGAWSQVESVCRYVLGRDPTNKWCLVSLSATLVLTGRPREAQDWAAELVRLYPDSEQAYFQLGQALKAQDLEKQAQDVFDRGLANVPKSELLTYYRLVNAFDIGEPDVCSHGVTDAVTRFERSGTLRVLLARCQAEAGQTERSLETLREAVDRGFAQVRRLEETKEFEGVARLPGFAALRDRESEPATADATPVPGSVH